MTTNRNIIHIHYSLMYEIKTEDIYEDLNSNKEMFDFSNYSTKLRYYDNSNK